MAQVRGALVSSAVQFVRETYGPDAHERVLGALDPRARATLGKRIRDSSFEPVEHFVAYIEAARQILAPDDAGFFRSLGRYTGRRARDSQGFKVMVAEPESAVRMAPITWKAFYDTGRADARMTGPREALIRLVDFPSRASLCERSCGTLEGLVSTETLQATVEHTRCIARSDPCCEYRIMWTEAGPRR
jgi:hypothetical protein